jgi:putative sterol carrier protein
MAVDIQKLFNEEVPAKINANKDAAKQIGATYQFVITGEGGGEWFINVKDDPKCEAGNPGGAECTMTLAAEDFQKLMENPQANGMQLFFGGKLKVAGNNMLAMKLQKLFQL